MEQEENSMIALNTALPILPISSMAQALNIHQRTLRIYDKEGILTPQRSEKNRRNYTLDDLEKAKSVLHLTRDLSINLAGVKMILAMLKVCEIEPKKYMDYIDKARKEAKIKIKAPKQTKKTK